MTGAMTGALSAHGAAAVARLMRPRAVAIVGISAKPGSAGHTVLANLTLNDYAGDIHLVGRSGGTIEGRGVLPNVDALPEGVDLAVFTLPAGGVREAIAACVRRKVGSAVIFASGFAEMGEDERGEQQAISALAREGGLALVGPNCLGYSNLVDGLSIGFAGASKLVRMAPDAGPGLAIVGQSGGLMGHLRLGLDVRSVPVSYMITTGNEAGLGLADFVEYLVEDAATSGIVIYAEDIRRPAEFLAAAAQARAKGKPIIVMHPGRGARAQAAARSHTGALAGDYAVMSMKVKDAGIALVDTLDELLDVSEILARYPAGCTGGAGILTFSGAFCGIALDFCEELGLDVPPLSPESEAALRPLLPNFLTPRNPLDLGTQPIWQPELVGIGAKALLSEPSVGGLVVSIAGGPPKQQMLYLDGLLTAMEGSRKPVTFSILGDESPLAPEFMAKARQNRVVLQRSSDRALRAMAQVNAYGRRAAAARPRRPAVPFAGLPALGSGPQAEWLGKTVLAAIGVATPPGGLARTVDEAAATAARIGYPVAMKAQAAALAHKTEAGGVLLGIADEAALRRAWRTLADNVGRAQPGLALDGALVEAMAPRGVELVIGAKRDPRWGPVLLVGLGGIWVEALGDVRLLPADLPEAAIAEELLELKSAKLLRGFRGTPPADIAAAARAAALVGRLIETVPEILEIDINPLVVHAEGKGATALDALIVTR